MKKAKIFLATIGLFAVIGGTVAFRTQSSYTGNLFCTTSYGTLPTLQVRYTISIIGSGRYCTTIVGVPATFYTRVTLNI